MKKSKFFSLMISSFIIVSIFLGCNISGVTVAEGAPAAGKAIKIGFSIQDISNPVWSEMYIYMEGKAKELGAEITLSDCQADPAKQIQSLENFIQGGYDAIIVHCFDAQSATSTLQQAKDKGIKIVAYDTYVDSADCYFGLNNYEVGKVIAKNAADYIHKTFPGAAVEIGICNYPLNQVCLDRGAGIEDGLAEYVPDSKIVAKAQAGYVDEGIVVGEIFVQAHPNMKVICGIDDAGLLGVYESFKAAGHLPEDFGMFGIDALPEALRLISEGSIYRSTIFLDLNRIGEKMVQFAFDLVNGEEVEKTTYFPLETVTIDNVAEYLR